MGFSGGRSGQLRESRRARRQPGSAMLLPELSRGGALAGTGTRPPGRHDLHPHHRLHRRVGDRDHHPHSPGTDQGLRRGQHHARGTLVRRPGLHLRAHAVHLRAGAGRAVRPRGAPARDPDLAVRARCGLHHHGVCALAGLALRGTPDRRRDGGEHHHRQRLHRRRFEAGGPRAQLRADRRGLWPGLHLRPGPGRQCSVASTCGFPSSSRRDLRW